MSRRSLGQHYLVDRAVIRRVVRLAGIRPGERVLEIGTGKGALTKELCRAASDVEGYEIDERNFLATMEKVSSEKLRLHHGDVFTARPRFDVLVSSLPYSRSSDFFEWISGMAYDRALVLLQDDFAEKVVSHPGNRDYRAISVIAQASAEVVVLERVQRSAFDPQPKIDTVIVSIKPTRRLSPSQIAGIKQLFALRRRTVAAVLGEQAREHPLAKRRIYSLTPEEALRLVQR
jgi:16S rRNA (adenine1518-N6/adenine1519-N6)-dimethyltransferase